MTDAAPRIILLSVWAETHALPAATARKWADEGNLPGAYKSGSVWLCPEDMPAPARRAPGRKAATRPGE